MKKQILLFFTLFSLIWANKSFSQMPLWSLPDKYLDVINATFSPLPIQNGIGSYGYQGDPATLNHQIMVDENGDIAFFLVNNGLYNKNGYLINLIGDQVGNEFPKQDVQSTGSLLSSEIAAVPRPGYCGQYYLIFSTNSNRHNNKALSNNIQVFYALVDINQPGEVTSIYGDKGTLLQHTNNFYSQPLYFVPLSLPEYGIYDDIAWGNAGIDITPLRSDGTRLMFLTLKGEVARFLIDANGINTDIPTTPPDDSEMGLYSVDHNGNTFQGPGDPYRSESEVIKTSSGYKLAYTFKEQDQSNGNTQFKLVLLELNNGGHIVNNYSMIFPFGLNNETLQPVGFEFSKDGSYLFCTHNIGTHPTLNTGMFRIDWTGSAPLQPEPINVPGNIDIQNSYIEIDKNGGLYLPDANNLYKLSNITGPVSGISISPAFPLTNYNPVSDYQFSGAVYKLPDQIDQGDYSYAPTYTCCLDFQNYQDVFTAPVGSSTWNPSLNPFNNATTVYIENELIFPTGSSVTISNMNFYFAEGARMVIEKGARVIAQNSVFTAQACNGIMWEGVQIEGTATSDQFTYPSNITGLFQLTNCEVSNAIIGVRTNILQGTHHDGNDEWGSTGGKIAATNTKFVNNQKDVQFLQYLHKNHSRFTNCEFLTTGPLGHPNLITSEHVSIFKNYYIYFLGCDFKNLNYSNTNHLLRGTGIKSVGSHYTVTYRCITNAPNFPTTCISKDRGSFEGLLYGVNAVNINLGFSVEVNSCDFNEVERGIYLGAVNNAMIVYNDFNLTTDLPPNTSFTNKSYGLYLHECDAYAVENNTFTLPVGASNPRTAGVYVYRSNPNNSYATNTIYRNEFYNLHYGIAAFGGNVHIDPTSGNSDQTAGLTFKCNKLNDSKIDHIGFINGVAHEQGNCDANDPANNVFTYHNRQGDIWNYDTDVHLDVFYSYDGSTSTNTAPQIYSSTVQLNNYTTSNNGCSPTFNYSQGCPVQIYPFSHQQKIDKIIYYQDLAAKGKQFLANVDAGVQHAWSDYLAGNISSGALKNTLQSFTPYISDSDIEMIMNSTLAPGLVQIILSNNSPLSEKNISNLYYSSLPKGVKTKVNNVQTGGITYRAQKELDIAYYLQESMLIMNSLARDYVHDTTVINGLDSLKFLIKNFGLDQSHIDCKITSINIVQKNYAKAQQSIDSLKLANPTDYDLFCKLNSLIIELNQDIAGCYSVLTDGSRMQKLNDLVLINDYSDKFCYRATEIYNQIFNLQYDEPIPNLVKTHAMSNYKEPLDFSSLVDDSYSIYPSPTSDVLTIETGTDEKITIKIFDITGKLMLSTQASTIATLNVSELSSGTYMVHMIYTDGTIKNDRFVKR